jgi:hypothetical protein
MLGYHCWLIASFDLILAPDGAVFEMAPGMIVDFAARRVVTSPQRPYRVSYALVFRPKSYGATLGTPR